MKKSIILCLSILMIAITGCKKNQNSWGKLEEGAINLKVGETKQLHFTSDGNEKPQWVSEDENIATVDANGNVTGVRVGSAYVTVNGLQCKVTVTDDFMYVIEPIQDWMADSAKVETYMNKYFGAATIPTYEHDTTKVIVKIEYDTVYVPGVDPAEIDTVIADTTFLEIPYVKKATYEYPEVLEGQFANKYVYEFECEETDKPGVYSSFVRVATMTVTSAHLGEIEKYLNNRYVESSKGNYRAANDWYYYSYILNASPEIIFSASKIEDK